MRVRWISPRMALCNVQDKVRRYQLANVVVIPLVDRPIKEPLDERPIAFFRHRPPPCSPVNRPDATSRGAAAGRGDVNAGYRGGSSQTGSTTAPVPPTVSVWCPSPFVSSSWNTPPVAAEAGKGR